MMQRRSRNEPLNEGRVSTVSSLALNGFGDVSPLPFHQAGIRLQRVETSSRPFPLRTITWAISVSRYVEVPLKIASLRYRRLGKRDDLFLGIAFRTSPTHRGSSIPQISFKSATKEAGMPRKHLLLRQPCEERMTGLAPSALQA